MIVYKGRVLAKLLPIEETTKNGIVIPQTARQNTAKAVVIQSGLSEVAVGDTILYAKNSGVKTNENDEELILLRGSDIFAVIE